MSVFTPEEITELAANSGRKSSFITTPYANSWFFWRCFHSIRVFTRYSCYWNNAKGLDHLLVF